MRLVLLAAFALVAGCGSDDPKTTVTAADGSKVTVTGDEAGEVFKMQSTGADGTVTSTIAGAGAAWPKSAPDFAAAYPGARITSVVDGVAEGRSSGMATFETDDTPAQLVAFYKARAAAAKLGSVTEISADATTMFSASDDASGRGVSVQASVAEGKTTGAVTFSGAKSG